jgi:hypothetical protein
VLNLPTTPSASPDSAQRTDWYSFFACLRGQSAVISSDHSNSLASIPYRQISRFSRYRHATTALVALNAQHIELAQVAEDDGAFAGHVKASYIASRSCLYQVTRSCLRGFLPNVMVSYCVSALAPRAPASYRTITSRRLRGLRTPYLAGSLPAFFLFVSGCPALNTAAVRLLW